MYVTRATLIAIIALAIAGCGGSDSVATATSPSITRQPVGVSVVAPDAATFSVGATGSPPLAYQWRRGGADIAGATAASYATPPTVPADSGATFAVTVSNAAGATTSAAAVLTVSAPTPGVLERRTVVQAGVARSYLRYLPDRLPATAVPLVIVLHGGSEDAAVTASPARATSAWRDLADLQKFVVAFPDGTDGRWRDCRSDSSPRPGTDDTAFVGAVIDHVAAERAIDLERVYVTGSSNGGMMAYRIGLELSDRVAGIGGVIANLPVDPARECPQRPARPLSVVIMNGTSDPLMPFAGGPLTAGTGGTVVSATATRDYWLSVNGCATTPAITSLPDVSPGDGSTVSRELFGQCAGGASVAFYRVDGGGHDMPSRRYFTGALRQNRDVEGAEEIWSVLRNARRSR